MASTLIQVIFLTSRLQVIHSGMVYMSSMECRSSFIHSSSPGSDAPQGGCRKERFALPVAENALPLCLLVAVGAFGSWMRVCGVWARGDDEEEDDDES